MERQIPRGRYIAADRGGGFDDREPEPAPSHPSVDAAAVLIAEAHKGSPSRLPWFAIGALLVIILLACLARDSSVAGYDALADWATSRALLDGRDPYREIEVVAAESGLSLGSFAGVESAPHPRLPGALLLTAPLSFLTPHQAYLAVMALSLLAGLVVLGWTAQRFRMPVAVMVGALTVLSTPVITAFQFGTWSVLLAALLLYVWRGATAGKSPWLLGIALGVVTVLKVFPGLLLIPLLFGGAKRTVAVALSSFVTLNVVTMAVFSVDWRQVVDAMRWASDSWLPYVGNVGISGGLSALGVPASVAGLLPPVAAIISIALLWRRTRSLESVLAAAVVVSVVASPLSWGHYQVALFPVAAWLWSVTQSRWCKGSLIVWAALWGVIHPFAADVLPGTLYQGVYVGGTLIAGVALFSAITRLGFADPIPAANPA